MKIYIAFTRKNIIALIALFLIALSLTLKVCSAFANGIEGDTEKKRLAFIENLGITVFGEPSVKEITIPESFSDVYENYNKMQEKAGFDLSKYKGETAKIYSYKEKDKDRIVNLIVCKGMLIGGDISETKLSGEMLPLME